MIVGLIVFSLIIIVSIVFGVAYYSKTGSASNSEKIKKTVGNHKNSNAEQIRIANRKGELGEFKIDRQFQHLPEGYRYINDLMIKKGRGQYSQIDHVVICPFGLFVVETKNYSGKIYGNEQQNNWTQWIGGNKYRPYNPIKQNKTHIKALQKLLKEFGPQDVYSIISFTRRCELKIDLNLRTADAPVMVAYDTDVLDFIKKKIRLLQSKNQGETLRSETIENIYQFLTRENITDPKAREEHINQIKKQQGA